MLTSSPWPRPDQTAAAAAVPGGVQARNAWGETPSTSAAWPLTVTCPPSSGSTARTPPSLPILASCAEVIPPGAAAMRSGTNSCRGGAPGDPGDPAIGAGVGAVEWPPKPPGVITARAAGSASPATLRHSVTVATAVRTARRQNADITMHTTI